MCKAVVSRWHKKSKNSWKRSSGVRVHSGLIVWDKDMPFCYSLDKKVIMTMSMMHHGIRKQKSCFYILWGCRCLKPNVAEISYLCYDPCFEKSQGAKAHLEGRGGGCQINPTILMNSVQTALLALHIAGVVLKNRLLFNEKVEMDLSLHILDASGTKMHRF